MSRAWNMNRMQSISMLNTYCTEGECIGKPKSSVENRRNLPNATHSWRACLASRAPLRMRYEWMIQLRDWSQQKGLQINTTVVSAESARRVTTDLFGNRALFPFPSCDTAQLRQICVSAKSFVRCCLSEFSSVLHFSVYV